MIIFFWRVLKSIANLFFFFFLSSERAGAAQPAKTPAKSQKRNAIPSGNLCFCPKDPLRAWVGAAGAAVGAHPPASSWGPPCQVPPLANLCSTLVLSGQGAPVLHHPLLCWCLGGTGQHPRVPPPMAQRRGFPCSAVPTSAQNALIRTRGFLTKRHLFLDDFTDFSFLWTLSSLYFLGGKNQEWFSC